MKFKHNYTTFASRNKDTLPFPFNNLDYDVIENNLNGESECEFLSSQKMWYIPRVYVCNKSDSYGNVHFLYSNKPKEGYHLHPAFMDKGRAAKAIRYFVRKQSLSEINNAKQSIVNSTGSLYPWPVALNYLLKPVVNALQFSGTNPSLMDLGDASTLPSVTPAQAQAFVNAFNSAIGSRGGWYLMNLYDSSLLQRLQLQAFTIDETINLCYTSFIRGNAKDNMYYGYYITNRVPYGSDTLKVNRTSPYHIFIKDNKGNGNWIDTGLVYNNAVGYGTEVFTNTPNAWHLEKGDNYDLGDVFLPRKNGMTLETTTQNTVNLSRSYSKTVNGKTYYAINGKRTFIKIEGANSTEGTSTISSDYYTAECLGDSKYLDGSVLGLTWKPATSSLASRVFGIAQRLF